MLKRLISMALLAVALGATAAQAESDLDFTLVNKTGYGIKEVYIGPTTSKDWGENLLEEPLENNESIEITFHPKAAKIQKWDLMVVWVDDDEDVYWRGYKLSEINRITLKYNRETGQTTAVTE